MGTDDESRRQTYRDYATTNRPYDQAFHQKLQEVTLGA
jgi:hypothetical protein